MFTKKSIVLFAVLSIAAVLLAACGGAAGNAGAAGSDGSAGVAGPAGPEGPAGPAADMADLSCTECHNETPVIQAKKESWETSTHGSGTAAAYAGGRATCTGCHSSQGFSAKLESGLLPGEMTEAPSTPAQISCRACHEIHTSYTGDDWALVTSDPVVLFAFEDVTFDGGAGNLCASCHQPRRAIAEAVDGMIEITSTHWGPHHGPQSAMLLGVGAAGVEGKASAHALMVEDTCVACHIRTGADHSMGATLSVCQECHADAESFDINGLQTEVEEKLAEVGELLEAKGLIHDGHPNPGTYPEAEAQAAWNWIWLSLEDGSAGVHNPAYALAMLEAALDALK